MTWGFGGWHQYHFEVVINTSVLCKQAATPPVGRSVELTHLPKPYMWTLAECEKDGGKQCLIERGNQCDGINSISVNLKPLWNSAFPMHASIELFVSSKYFEGKRGLWPSLNSPTLSLTFVLQRLSYLKLGDWQRSDIAVEWSVKTDWRLRVCWRMKIDQ